LWLHSLKVAQLLRSAACLHTNQSRSYLNHLVFVASSWFLLYLLIKDARSFEHKVYKYKFCSSTDPRMIDSFLSWGSNASVYLLLESSSVSRLFSGTSDFSTCLEM